ncbi:MAG: transcription antiterminator [Lachnospiraceae bacterium]|nr:transcription antiterminator [Lachnospiraceae bacterium]
MELTSRAEKIIRILARFPQDHPVTISVISEELGVSDRSVQRELPIVEKWLTGHGFDFSRRRSVGLVLHEPEGRKKALIALLDENTTADIPADDRRERQRQVRCDILLADQPLKFYYFTEKYGISEGTLASDLNQAAAWFEGYHLQLIRRPGLGVFLEGSETARRQAATSFLCSQLNEKQYHSLLRKPGGAAGNAIIEEIDSDITNQVNPILADCEQQLNLNLSDNAYLHLLVYLSLTIQRMKKGCFIQKQPDSADEMSILPEYAVAEYLMKQIHQCFRLPASAPETLYLTTYLSGIRIWPTDHRDLTRHQDFNIHQITLEIVKKAGALLGVDFTDDSQLLRDLSAHIQPTIGRLRAGIPIENPILEDLQDNYGTVFHASEEAADILCKALELPGIPSSEIGFISIYFVMALERAKKLNRRVSAIIVCPTGIGSSRLLASSLQQEYPDLNICRTVSAFEIDGEKLAAQGIDLVISTVKLSINHPYLHVNPLLTRQDKMLLDSKIKLLLQQKEQVRPTAAIPVMPLARADVEYVSSLGTEIFHLLDHITIRQAPVLKSREEIIRHGASLFGDTPELEQHLYGILKKGISSLTPMPSRSTRYCCMDAVRKSRTPASATCT